MAKNNYKELAIAFGNRVRKIRLERSWSQNDLEGFSGIDRVQIERIENGKINTTIGTANQLAKAFNMKLSELFDEVNS